MGYVAAMAYDEAFRKHPSQSASTLWDLINYKHWLVEVGPNNKGRPNGAQMLQGGRVKQGEGCAGSTMRASAPGQDVGSITIVMPAWNHTRVACPRQRTVHQPFRGSRPPSKPNIQCDAQGGGPAAPTAADPERDTLGGAGWAELASSPIKLSGLAPLLLAYPNRKATLCLWDGFNHGFPIPYVAARVGMEANNLKSARELPHVVGQKLTKEIAVGRMVGPFDHPPWCNFGFPQ